MGRSIPVLKLPEKMYYSLFQQYVCYYILLTLNFIFHFSQTEFAFLILLILLIQNLEHLKKYRHKSNCITTQLTTFYCYSTINSITNLSNKQLFLKKFKGGYHPIIYPISTFIPSPSICKKSLNQPLTLIQCSIARLTYSEKQNENQDCKL